MSAKRTAQTAAKRAREQAVRERRERKVAKKRAAVLERTSEQGRAETPGNDWPGEPGLVPTPSLESPAHAASDEPGREPAALPPRAIDTQTPDAGHDRE